MGGNSSAPQMPNAPPRIQLPPGLPPNPFDPGQTASTQYGGFTLPAAQATRFLNLPSNVSSPFGSISTTQTGTAGGMPQFTTTTTLSPEQQALETQRQNLSLGAGGTAGGIFGGLGTAVDKPFDLTNASVEGRLIDLGSRRLDPILSRQWDQTETALANKGIMPGSEAYREAQAQFDRARNDAYNQLLLTGRTQAANEATTAYTTPIEERIKALGGLSPYISGAQMPTAAPALPAVNVAAPDFAGLTSGEYGQELGATTSLLGAQAAQDTGVYNTQAQAAQAQANRDAQFKQGLWGALGGIGGTILGGPVGGAIGGWATKKFLPA